MEIENIKNTDAWKILSTHPKFEEEFERVLRDCCFYVDKKDLRVVITDKKITLFYNTQVKNRDLDCQFKKFNSTSISLDDNNNLLINEFVGKLESNYGYDFQNSDGGKLNTHYSCQIYDNNGIEISYQAYGDQYKINKESFQNYSNDLQKVVVDAYNPNLMQNIYHNGVNCRPKVIGNNSRFIKKMRLNDNMGIVEVYKCSFNKDSNVDNLKDEYYFNTFQGSKLSNSPELMQFIHGFPFAVIDENKKMQLKGDYSSLGLTINNYQDIARERFLKELMKAKELQNDERILDKYDIMIEQMEKELGIGVKTR